jgi:PBSX family phage terminase large subunit
MPSKMTEPFIKKTCQHCNIGHYVEFPDENEWNVQCNECSAILFCYNPLPHQQLFHADGAKYRLYAGGYGSGKTTTSVAEVIRHVLSTPKGTTLMGAATLPQLENTSMKQFFEMMPPGFIDNYAKQKMYVDLINGHRILFRPLDDPGKARSLNLTCFHIEEASEVGYDYFVQLQTRLRNHATTRHIGILSSNPDLGWIRSEFLLKSARIHNAQEPYFVPEEDKNTNYSTHIAPTRLNTYLPPDFYYSTAQGKPAFWVNRYLNGSFSYSEGAVYHDFAEHIIPPFKIPEHWERMGGSDFGIRDHTVLLMGAIDPDTGITYLYDEYYKNNLPVPEHAKKMVEIVSKVPYGKLRFLVADPSGKKQNIQDMRSLFDHYAEYGLWFQAGNNRIDAGLAKTQAYFSLGKLKIFSSCVNTIKEGINYKYKPEELDSKKNPDNKPIDKDNHAMDSLRYMINELPDDPEQLKQKSYSARDWGGKVEADGRIPFALQTDEQPKVRQDAWLYY